MNLLRLFFIYYAVAAYLSQGYAQGLAVISPSDNSTVNTGNVLFSWTPVSYSGQTIQYEFTLREILSGQTVNQALFNTPLEQQTVAGTTYNSLWLIQEGKAYIWTVQAYINEMNYSQEIRVLQRINLPYFLKAKFQRNMIGMRISVEEEDFAFINLDKGRPENYEYFIPYDQDTIYIKYIGRYANDSVTVQLYSYNSTDSLAYQNDSILDVLEDTMPVSFLLNEHYKMKVKIGNNYLKLPKSHLVNAPHSAYLYFLEIKNKTGEIYRSKIEFE